MCPKRLRLLKYMKIRYKILTDKSIHRKLLYLSMDDGLSTPVESINSTKVQSTKGIKSAIK